MISLYPCLGLRLLKKNPESGPKVSTSAENYATLMKSMPNAIVACIHAVNYGIVISNLFSRISTLRETVAFSLLTVYDLLETTKSVRMVQLKFLLYK